MLAGQYARGDGQRILADWLLADQRISITSDRQDTVTATINSRNQERDVYIAD